MNEVLELFRCASDLIESGADYCNSVSFDIACPDTTVVNKTRTVMIADKVAFFVLAKSKPEESVFGDTFTDLRDKARDFKENLELQAKESLQDSLIKSIKDRGYKDVSVEISLGKYRGSRFIAFAKVSVVAKNLENAKELVGFLKQYHPKYMLKDFDEDTKTAVYNIR